MDDKSPAEDELDALRRRAYGPDADIGADPSAQARLADLERQLWTREYGAPAVARTAPPIGRATEVDPPPTVDTAHGGSAAPDAGDQAEPGIAGTPAAAAPGAGARGWMRRALPWLIVAGAGVVAIALGAMYVDAVTEPTVVSPSVAAPATPPVQPNPCPGAGVSPSLAGLEPPSDGAAPRESQAPRRTRVTADYRFENSLADSVGAATELSAIGAHATGFLDEAVLGQTSPVLAFDRGSGLELTPASVAIGREYTIELVFRFDRLDGFAKIIDFNNAAGDCGLYSLDGRMNFWPIITGFGAALVPDSYAHVVLTRDATDNVVAYVNGARQLSFHDTGDVAVIDANDTLRLFSDDTVTPNEDSGGAVSRIRLYDGPLSASDVAVLAAE